MARWADVSGERFGHLVAVEPTGEVRNGSAVWRCECDCGNVIETPLAYLRIWKTSCGCRDKRRGMPSEAGSLVGHRFGRLTVVAPAGRGSNGHMRYRCECDCGGDTVASAGNLLHGNVKSCGCLRGRRHKPVSPGDRFGELTVVREVKTAGSGPAHWLCECSCGRRAVFTTNLLRFQATRCGWLHGEPMKGGLRSLAGERFGKLLVIREQRRRDNGSVVWRCRCDCGALTDVSARNLVNGHTTSCGCARGKPVEVGEVFGALTVKERVENDKRGHSMWLCECSCGGTVVANGIELREGNVTSCGCGVVKRARINEANGVVDGTRLSMLGSKPPKNNSSGVRGVYWNKRKQRWVAQIKFHGKNRHLGSFRDLAEAAEARRAAEQELFDPVLEDHGWRPSSEAEYEEALRKAIDRTEEQSGA